MLYDNALLAYTYLEAAELNGEREFGRMAEEIIAMLCVDLQRPDARELLGRRCRPEAGEGGITPGRCLNWQKFWEQRKRRVSFGHYNVTDKGNLSTEPTFCILSVFRRRIMRETKRSERELAAQLEECRKSCLKQK